MSLCQFLLLHGLVTLHKFAGQHFNSNGDITPSCFVCFSTCTCFYLFVTVLLTQHLYMLIRLLSRFFLRRHSYGLSNRPSTILPIETAGTLSAPSPASLCQIAFTLPLLSTLLLSLPIRYSNTFSSIALPCNNVLSTFLLTPPTGPTSFFCQTSGQLPRRKKGVEDSLTTYPQNLSKVLPNFTAGSASTLGVNVVPCRTIRASLLF